MAMVVPDWLARHGGSLRQASDGITWFVMVDGEPFYTVVPRPVAGKFGSFIKHTNSGQPVDSPSTASGQPEAFAAALEDLRKFLGW